MASVQVLLEQRELRMARDLREAGPLVEELVDVRGMIGAKDRERMGAEGEEWIRGIADYGDLKQTTDAVMKRDAA